MSLTLWLGLQLRRYLQVARRVRKAAQHLARGRDLGGARRATPAPPFSPQSTCPSSGATNTRLSADTEVTLGCFAYSLLPTCELRDILLTCSAECSGKECGCVVSAVFILVTVASVAG